MAFSFVRIILSDTEIEIYNRGLSYFNQEKVDGKAIGTAGYKAVVNGTDQYHVDLGFKRIGGPRYNCSCPYYERNKYVCKHIIAAALFWDNSRNVPVPTKEDIALLCIPPPDVTYGDIKKAYEEPLDADLNILRLAADNVCTWSRPHAQLPQKPIISENKFVTSKDLLFARKKLLSWSNRRQYDMYFCAGEMEAGFCEILRLLKQTILSFSIKDQLEALKVVVELHHEILERIDDSDGLHIFGEAHLGDLSNIVATNKNLTVQDKAHLKKNQARIKDY